jgi:CubicO group peptidase (beta-lactamase class C family)
MHIESVSVVLLWAASWGPGQSSTESDPAVAECRESVKELMESEHLPAISVAVMSDSEILWSEAFGFAHLEHQVPATVRTKFRIGSISKSLTSVALGALMESGQLDLDADVRIYVPEYPDKGQPITTRQLAGHLSGIPHYNREDVINRVRYRNVIHALDKFKDRPLLFVPGERYAYSSFGWNLIAAIVERAAEEPFLQFMEESVFQAADMQDTCADEYDKIIAHRTAFYGLQEGQALNAPAVDNSDVWAGGGFLSTPEDLVRFGHALLSGELVDEATMKLLFTPLETTSGVATGYGLGWQAMQIRGYPMVGHGGSHVGATAQLFLVPDQFLIVALTTNTSSAGLTGLALELVDRFLP